MTTEEILSITLLNSWKLIFNRFDMTLGELTDEQLQRQAAKCRWVGTRRPTHLTLR
jgi:hypothetical protein